MGRLVRVRSHYRRVGGSSSAGGILLLVVLALFAIYMILLYVPWIILAVPVVGASIWGLRRLLNNRGAAPQTNGYTPDFSPAQPMYDTRYIPEDIRRAVHQRYSGRCALCGSTYRLEYDHIIPLSRGGATSLNNLQVLCRECNRRKGAGY